MWSTAIYLPEVGRLLDVLSRCLGSRAALSAAHVELRVDDTVQTAIDVRDDKVEVVSQRSDTGHSARVLCDGTWGFAASHGSRGVESTISEAVSAARGIGRHDGMGSVELADVKPQVRSVPCNPPTPLKDILVADKLRFLQGICLSVRKKDPRISTARASYREMTGKRYLATGEGTSIETEVSSIYLMCTASGADGSTVGSSRDEVARVCAGWELFEKAEPSERISERLVAKVRGQLDGVTCKRGSFPCVLGPRVVGMLAHEALGHLSEADYFASGAFAGKEGRLIAPKDVTMVDSPRLKDGFGNIDLDDEGVVPRKVTLIEQGRLKDKMTNREWAARLGSRPSGSARAETYKVPPIIRMRNTYFEKGDRSLAELLHGVKRGYYCGDVRGGQAEANSSFQVAIQDCFEIRDGEMGRPVRGLAISGVALKSLKLIDGLGKDFGIESSYCGKSDQYMATSDGGPHMRFRKGGIIFGGGE